jgi:hypothetical protein
MPFHSSWILVSYWFNQFDTTRADGQFRKPASNKKLLSLVSHDESEGGSFKFTSFDEALEHTVGWFLQNYDTARTGKVKDWETDSKEEAWPELIQWSDCSFIEYDTMWYWEKESRTKEGLYQRHWYLKLGTPWLQEVVSLKWSLDAGLFQHWRTHT